MLPVDEPGKDDKHSHQHKDKNDRKKECKKDHKPSSSAVSSGASNNLTSDKAPVGALPSADSAGAAGPVSSSATSKSHSLKAAPLDWSMGEEPFFSTGHQSDSDLGSSDDRELLSTPVDQEVNEEMSCRETIRSVHSSMGWTHILWQRLEEGE